MKGRIFVKAFLILAIALAFTGLATERASAIFVVSDTYALASDGDSEIVNGKVTDFATGNDSTGGFLWIGYTKTNGTRTNAQAQGTQDTYYRSDTVLFVPTAKLTVEVAADGDSKLRQFVSPAPLGSFNGKWPGFGTGDTLPHKIPEDGETIPIGDSVVVLQIELNDTGALEVHILNTSNYACTAMVLIHIPDSDFNAGFRGQGYNEEAQGVLSKFRITLSNDSISNSAPFDSVGTGSAVFPYETMARTSYGRIAEEAETTFFLRISSNSSAFARDSLCLTMYSFPDSAQQYTTNHRRVLHDTGYIGDNDTHYGRGGAEDSVSAFVYVATAIVRVTKRDSVFAPMSYRAIVDNGSDTTGRARDTVPGATIVYTIYYDNDGNRRADSLTFIDFLDSNVDFSADTLYASNAADDTYFASNGVDTRLSHNRVGYNAPGDTMIIVEFASRAAPTTFNQETLWASGGSPAQNSVIETVGAIRIRWSSATVKDPSLRRDQIDELSYTGSAMDPLDRGDSNFITTTGSSDSGDAGRIRFAVVIR